MKFWLTFILSAAFLLFTASGVYGQVQTLAEKTANKSDAVANIVSVKIDGAISSPQVYIVKRAIRYANSTGAKFLVLDMNTPGGDMASTLEIMDSLADFKGESVCFVNTDAISAGSFIAVACDKIWFSPKGVMGAAETVNATGGDIDASMQRKLTSFLAAKVRTFADKNSRRADVQRAMNDPDYILKIGNKTVKEKGSLLTLTAKEATEKIDGAPLLADGIADSLPKLAEKIAGKNVVITELKITWSEKFAKYISSISPILLGLGFFLIFMEVKSGSFGILATLGIGLLLVVFLGANMAGIAGYEEILIFLLGAILVGIEIFLFTGTFIFGILGGVLMIGSAAWALGDIRPARGFDYNFAAFGDGVLDVGTGLAITILLLILLWKFLPSTSLWSRLVLNTPADADTPKTLLKSDIVDADDAEWICVSDLSPTGRISLNGKIVEAVAEFGVLSRGDRVKIVAKKDFYFVVKKV